MKKAEISYAAIIINSICTLKCKNCITRTPYQSNPHNFPKKNIMFDIENAFLIYDHMMHLDFEGGETLLHPDIAEIVKFSFKYTESGSCDEIRILTNCTVIPNQKLIDTCKEGKFLFLLDDYGPKLSVNKDKIITLLEKNEVPYRVDTYNGDNQYYGGWIDFGDFQFKNNTQEELQWRVTNCRSAQNMPDIKDGIIYLCGPQMSGMKHIELKKGEFIDLRDTSMTLEERIEMAVQFGKKPINHCSYCNGFILDSKRIKAAEQLEEITDDMKVCN